jgi:hypothetical protein
MRAALEWAGRGFRVFPLRANTREPAFKESWVSLASNDPEIIKSLWTDIITGAECDYNIGCVCTGLVVLDIDVKNGKKGYEEYETLKGSYDTLVVQTTSGGFHCYFNGPDSTNSPISSAIDVRSHNGYVVAPGSVIDGREYVVINNAPIAPIQEHIKALLKPYKERSSQIAQITYTDASVDAAIRFLQSAPPAIQGALGDETTFKVAARLVRELALDTATALSLMLDIYNPRCAPPWTYEELERKIENAKDYGLADHGVLTSDALFNQVVVISEPDSLFSDNNLDFGNAVEASQVKPREWVSRDFLLRGASSIIMAAGSAGKSTISLVVAAHLAVGQDFGPYKTEKIVKSVIYNGEDDIMEQSRRLWAICSEYNFDYNTVKSNIMLISAREFKLILANGNKGGNPTRNAPVIQQLKNKCKNNNVGLLVLDPLVRVHTCNESDNVEMDFVMDTVNDIAHEANLAVLLLHHTSKGGVRPEDKAGNMDIGRGASAIVNASRIGLTLLSAGIEDATAYGIPEADKRMYVRMDDAKMNLSLASDKAMWFKKSGVKIPSGDCVGVLKITHLEKSTNHIRVLVAKCLIPHFEESQASTMPVSTALALIKSKEPLMKNKTDADIKKSLEAYYTTPLDINGRLISFVRDGADSKRVCITYT